MDWISGLIALVFGSTIGFVAHMLMSRYQSQSAEQRAKARLDAANRASKDLRREAEIHARSEMIRVREEFEATARERRSELAQAEAALRRKEESLIVREENLDRKADILDRKEQAIDNKQNALDRKSAEVSARETAVGRQEREAARAAADADVRLQKLAAMTRDEARRDLFERTEREVRNELGGRIRRIQEETQANADAAAANILVEAMYRYAGSHAAGVMTSYVAIPNEEMKGRIIGREGRNIRAFEAATGVTLQMDDGPDVIVLSAFDPVRREIAKRALESLVKDGRIHPARIEETVQSVTASFDDLLLETGREAFAKAGVPGPHPDVARTLGRLKFRTSFSQNVLVHSLEVSALMGVMAAEIGLDEAVARRVGLLHDIGKALDHEIEGGHATIGADFLRKLGEDETVLAGVATHHDQGEASLYGMLCATADAISSSRPGARAEETEVYLHRIEKIEQIAGSFPGVAKCYAVQSGREARVIVDPEKVGDGEAVAMARDICRRIEAELKFPGQIRVVVIRETRCVEYAR